MTLGQRFQLTTFLVTYTYIYVHLHVLLSMPRTVLFSVQECVKSSLIDVLIVFIEGVVKCKTQRI